MSDADATFFTALAFVYLLLVVWYIGMSSGPISDADADDTPEEEEDYD